MFAEVRVALRVIFKHMSRTIPKIMAELQNIALHPIHRLPFRRLAIRLHIKTLYSWLTKPQTLKLNAKTGGSAPQNPLNCLWLAISN